MKVSWPNSKWFFPSRRKILASLFMSSTFLFSAASATNGIQFFVSGRTVQIFDNSVDTRWMENPPSPIREIEVGQSSRVADAIATFNGAVQVTFSNLMRTELRTYREEGRTVFPDVPFANPNLDFYPIQQRNPGIYIRQLQLHELARENLNLEQQAGLLPSERWLAFYVQDAGGPMASTAPSRSYPMRHFIGVARFQKSLVHSVMDFSRHRSFGTKDELESPEWGTTLVFFENISDSMTKLPEPPGKETPG